MSDLISRSELIEEIERQKNNVENDGTWSYFTTMKIAELFEEIVNREPIVEAKPVVHGEWERIGSGSLYDTYECTNCHRPPKWDCLGDNHWRIAFTDICPHCGAIMNGADMRGGKNE